MSEFTLELDRKSSRSLNELMNYYKTRDRGEIIGKAIAILKVAAHIEKTEGELLARKGNQETKIIVT